MSPELMQARPGAFVRESVILVAEYVIGTLELTPFPRLTSQERYTFSPAGHTAEWLARIFDQYCMDMMLLETRDKQP